MLVVYWVSHHFSLVKSHKISPQKAPSRDAAPAGSSPWCDAAPIARRGTFIFVDRPVVVAPGGEKMRVFYRRKMGIQQPTHVDFTKKNGDLTWLHQLELCVFFANQNVDFSTKNGDLPIKAMSLSNKDAG